MGWDPLRSATPEPFRAFVADLGAAGEADPLVAAGHRAVAEELVPGGVDAVRVGGEPVEHLVHQPTVRPESGAGIGLPRAIRLLLASCW